MHLSVLLCTYNNCERLRITLEAFTDCNVSGLSEWELIVVGNNCADQTREVVTSFQDALPLVYVEEPRQGLSKARNAGLQQAQGQFVIFTDDDVTPDREWILTYVSAYQEYPDGFYFGGPIVSEFEGEPPHPAMLELSPHSVRGLSYGPEIRKLQLGEGFLSANWACAASVLREEGGFREDLGLDPSTGEVRVGEETDLQHKLSKRGMIAMYLPSASLKHFVPSDKCTMSHISKRIDAMEYQSTKRNKERYEGSMLGGAPRWLWREVLQSWLVWKFPLYSAKHRYQALARHFSARGALRAYREVKHTKTGQQQP